MPETNPDTIVGLNQEEKQYLLALARTTITHVLESGKLPETKPVSENVKKKFGVFVTLHKKGNLRGCIGYVEGVEELYRAVMVMAQSAAFRDPRFPAVTRSELKDLEIEISVLSPLKKISDVGEIEIGKHGLIIQKGLNRGLLLPQVAEEWNWNRQEFLQQTCRKANLPTDAWDDEEVDIYIFSAEIFSENDVKLTD